ncbi:MAG: hypothetical protein RhofKO_22160 [Rhodothermales bacterium]
MPSTARQASRSCKPHTLQPSNVDDKLKAKMLQLRQKRNLGPKRIQAELMRHEGTKHSTSTIYKVLKRAKVGALKRQRKSRPPKRYSLDVPGERVQIDSMKVAAGLYQFTAIDPPVETGRLHTLSRARTLSEPLVEVSAALLGGARAQADAVSDPAGTDPAPSRQGGIGVVSSAVWPFTGRYTSGRSSFVRRVLARRI